MFDLSKIPANVSLRNLTHRHLAQARTRRGALENLNPAAPTKERRQILGSAFSARTRPQFAIRLYTPHNCRYVANLNYPPRLTTASSPPFMSTESIIAAHWSDIIARASPAARSLLGELSRQEATGLSKLFYDVLLQDPSARLILSNDDVENRLSASLQRWIIDVLNSGVGGDIDALLAQQRHIGIMHARLNVRVDLVLRGARLIKNALHEALFQAQQPEDIRADATRLATNLIDLAIEAMSAAYSHSHDKATRTDEAFRTYAATVNMSLERERQRGALFDWSNRMLQDMVMGQGDMALSRIGQSSFGLWIRHKAPALFANREELADILRHMQEIDHTLLPLCERGIADDDAASLRRATRTIVAAVEQIRLLIETLFDHLVHLESGRDTQTQLLNRRFLPTVLAREIELCRNMENRFAVLLLDIDHFKSVNDRFGHDAGDRVLERVSNVLSNNARSGDFAFRYGGEEFLLICVEQTPEQALQMAENIRRDVETHSITIASHETLNVTISIGVAMHDGHPDYQRLIERADEALYQAKQGGRNRCVLASS